MSGEHKSQLPLMNSHARHREATPEKTALTFGLQITRIKECFDEAWPQAWPPNSCPNNKLPSLPSCYTCE